MGYTTYFHGSFMVSPPLQDKHRLYLEKFAQTRRIQRDETLACKLPDPIREATGLPLGPDGGYFVGGIGFLGQANDLSVTEHNRPPKNQPGLWCQWVPTEDGAAIVWDEGEKFSDYIEWLEYLIANFLKPWEYTLNGEVRWQGEDSGDLGVIYVKDNKVQALSAEIVQPQPNWEEA